MRYLEKKRMQILFQVFVKKKKMQQGGDIGEGKLLNVGYLQDQNSERAKKQAEKEEVQKKKLWLKKRGNSRPNIGTFGKWLHYSQNAVLVDLLHPSHISKNLKPKACPKTFLYLKKKVMITQNLKAIPGYTHFLLLPKPTIHIRRYLKDH